MSLRERTRPGLGIIEPCLPSPAKAPPTGPGWLHEIKHDGFRMLARRDSRPSLLSKDEARRIAVNIADIGSVYLDRLVCQDRERLPKARPARIRERAAE